MGTLRTGRLWFALFWSLMVGLGALVRGAPVTGTFRNSDGTAYTSAVTFRPVSSPSISGSDTITGADIKVTPNSSGYVSTTLTAGYYSVYLGSTRRFTIAVPSGSDTVDVTSILTTPAWLVPGEAGISGIITNTYAIATASVRGLVKTDSTSSDPVVDLSSTVTTKVNGSSNAIVAMTAPRTNGVQIVTDLQDLTTADPDNGWTVISTAAGFQITWSWSPGNNTEDDDHVRPQDGGGCWVAGARVPLPSGLTGSKGAVFGSNYRLVESTATKQQVDNTAMQVATVAAMRALTAAQINDGQLIQTGGRLTNGDGAGRTYYWAAASSATTNLVGVFAPVAGGTGRFIWTESGDLTPQLAGAVVDGTTDNTTEIQAASDYAEDNGLELFFPVGTYRATTLTCETARWRGILPQQERIQPGTSSIIVQHSSASGPLVRILYTTTAKPSIEDLCFVGLGDAITPSKRAITTVTDRFTFGVSTNYAPQLGTSASFPKQVAFFYTSEDRYLGSAFITGTSTVGANCIATIDSSWDNYATPTTSGFLLNTACKVVWSPIYTNSVGSLIPNPATAGYPCIEITGGLSGKFRNVMVNKFHTGIYAIGEVTPYWFYDGNVRFNYCEFAGMASAIPYLNADAVGTGSLIASGSYIKPGANVISWDAETLSITNAKARNTAFGFYNAFSGSGLRDLRTDQCVTGYYQSWEICNNIGYALFDNCIRYGFVSDNGFYGDILGIGAHIDYLQARRWFGSSDSTAAYFTNSSAIRVTGSSFKNAISVDAIDLGVNSQNGSTNYWTWAFDISGTNHEITIGAKHNLAGASNYQRSTTVPIRWNSPYSVSTAAQAINGWYSPDGTNVAFAAAGLDAFLTGSTDTWTKTAYIRFGTNAPASTGQYAFYSYPDVVGNGTTAVGHFFRANFNTAVSTEVIGVRIRAEVASGVTEPIVNGLVVMDAAGSGTATRVAGVSIDEQTKGTTANYNIRLGETSSTGPVGTYSIYNVSSRNNYFGGNLTFGSGSGPVFNDTSFLRGTTNYFNGTTAFNDGVTIGGGDKLDGVYYVNGTLVAGTKALSNGNITSTSKLTPYLVTAGGTPGALYVSAKGTGTCTVTSTSGSDTSVIGVLIVNP